VVPEIEIEQEVEREVEVDLIITIEIIEATVGTEVIVEVNPETV